jgi:hypothetical protein
VSIGKYLGGACCLQFQGLSSIYCYHIYVLHVVEKVFLFIKYDLNFFCIFRTKYVNEVIFVGRSVCKHVSFQRISMYLGGTYLAKQLYTKMKRRFVIQLSMILNENQFHVR